MKLIYIINSALEEIRKQKAIHVMIVICVFACTFFLTWVSLVVKPAYLDISTLLRFRDKEVLFFQINEANNSLDSFELAVKRMHKGLSRIENIELGDINDIKFSVGNNVYKTIVYDELVSNNAEVRLCSGIQLYEYEGNYVPILVTEKNSLLNQYDTGDIVDAQFSYELNGEMKKTIVKFEIVGELSYPYRYYRVASSGSNIISWDVLEVENTEAVILPDFEIETGLLLSDTSTIDVGNPFVYGKITAQKNSEEYIKTYNELRDVCRIISFDDVLRESLKNYSQGFSDQLLISVSLFLLLTVGIGSANIYIGKRQVRSFAINFISGAKWTHCLLIDIIRNLIVIIMPTVVGSTASAIIFVSDIRHTKLYSYDVFVITVLLIYMVILFLVSSLPYIIKLKNTEPITFVRTMNRE